MDIDKIWKAFGNDMQHVSVAYNPAENNWNIIYDDNKGNMHKASDKDMTKAAEAMLKWYEDRHTYKAAAESLWKILDDIDFYINSDYGFSIIKDEVSKRACYRHKFMTKEGDNLIWNESYKEKSKPAVKEQTRSQEPQQTDIHKNVLETLPEDSKSPEDGFPPFCALQTDSLTLMEYWGHDRDGNRIHVMINYSDNNQTRIDNRAISVKPEKVYEISEAEFMGYYKEANATISALKSGYGVDNFTQYNVQYAD